MKKLVYILLMFVIAFSACDPNEDIYDELDDLKEPYAGVVENYTFTADDYATAAEYAMKNAVTDDDTMYVEFIESMEAFNSFFTAEDYVGSVLAELYPEYNKKSTANVTYNYVAELPEDLAIYTNADIYTLTAADYEDASFDVGVADYFYPEYNPDYYIPGIIKNSITGAAADDIYKISYMYSNANPIISATNEFTESFDNGLGQFNATSILGDKDWYSSSYGDSYYASMSGYKQETEDWLISNPIVLDGDANSFNFTHEIKYLNGRWDQLSVAISSDYDGSDIEGATWDVIDWGDVADTANLGSGYDPYNSGDIDISAYANKTIYIAFKYTSTTENAPTWHILDVTVTPIKEVFAVEFGEAPYMVNEYYEYSGTEWSKVDDVYCLSDADYDAMGDPGDDNIFSADVLPEDYLPKFLDARYPEAGNGVVKTIVYQYESDIEGEVTLATEYTYKNGAWESAYDYIQETTNQFVHNGEEWLFDPTITRTMLSSDYQFIVEYVKEKYGEEYLNSYKTADFVYGCDSYYSEFDVNDFDPEHEEFSDLEGELTWMDGAEKAIGTILLPELYPDAQLQVNGVDMYYRIIVLAYDYGATANYAFLFKVTKAGPDPEFTLEGEPTEL